jgi:GAF domain-containing protein
MLTRRLIPAALLLAVFGGGVGCGPSQAELDQEIQQANEAQAKAAQAEAAARAAQVQADAATAAADKARRDVDAATIEINRVANHIDQMQHDKEDAGSDEVR